MPHTPVTKGELEERLTEERRDADRRMHALIEEKLKPVIAQNDQRFEFIQGQLAGMVGIGGQLEKIAAKLDASMEVRDQQLSDMRGEIHQTRVDAQRANDAVKLLAGDIMLKLNGIYERVEGGEQYINRMKAIERTVVQAIQIALKVPFWGVVRKAATWLFVSGAGALLGSILFLLAN